MTNPAGPPPTRLAPGKPQDHRPLAAPSFYITGRQPLRPEALLLAVAAVVGALSLVLYALSHTGGAGQKDDDDPNQVDTVVLGDPTDAPVLVFRLRDETPSATEVLGTLQVLPNSSPATIASFSLRAVPSPRHDSTGAAPASPAAPRRAGNRPPSRLTFPCMQLTFSN